MVLRKLKYAGVVLLLCGLFGCSGDNSTSQNSSSASNSNASASKAGGQSAKFNFLPISKTKVDFVNTLEETNQVNYYFDEYIYNGGGVGIGDINNDGLPDIFFAGNQAENRLYLNKGNMEFEDISESAGIQRGGWSNGVSMIDINNDGFLDIYVCRGGTLEKNNSLRTNQLFVNNGKNVFTEQAQKYGIADPSLSLNSAFLDYDRDGDLDLYVTNYPTKFKIGSKTINEKMNNPGQYESDKFFTNNGDGTFSDTGRKLGILNYGHGLGLGVGDINFDGYPDIYVGNDFTSDDYLYVNQVGNGFVDQVKNVTKHTSQFAMGLDIVDINNDMLLDIFCADMSAEDNFRSKAMMPSMDPENFWKQIKLGRHFQYMRNTLQLNNGNGLYSEIGQLANLEKTDWSWAPLFFDIDNDGLKDVYITNGYMRDLDEKDANKRLKKVEKKVNRQLRWDDILKEIKSTKLSNYVFKNNGDLSFSKMNDEWGETPPSFSNGMAYGDLDNDGDLDIVTSNLNDPAFIIENQASGNYLKIKLKGTSKNRMGIGAKVLLKYNGELQFKEHYLSRGYMSSVDPIMHFGLGDLSTVEQVLVKWHDGKESIVNSVKANQTIEISYANAVASNEISLKAKPKYFTPVETNTKISYRHIENEYDDYKNQVLLPHKLSQMGPHISNGDINGDGLIDFYVGGASGQSGRLFIQGAGNVFNQFPIGTTTADIQYEDMGSVFFDLENDGDLDLYIVSGGYERNGESFFQDRLYRNTNANIQPEKLPKITSSGSCAVAWDYNGDGFTDLFVGGRVVPDKYPAPADSYLLRNSSGNLFDATEEDAPFLKEFGMVTSAVTADLNKDGKEELIVVGDWMEIKVLSGSKDGVQDVSADYNLKDTRGWWNKIVKADLDKDGDMDFVIGNLGYNYKYKASKDAPFDIYSEDFDKNGTYDIVLGYYYDGEQYPVRGLQCSSEQMPFVKEDFPNYNEFASSDINEIYGRKLNSALHYSISSFASIVLWNDDGKLIQQALPNEAQFSPIFGAHVDDFNHDGNMDIAFAGNLMVSEVETGNADAGFGGVLLGDGNRNFQFSNPVDAGIICPFDTRDMIGFDLDQSKGLILVANNNHLLQSFGYNKKVN